MADGSLKFDTKIDTDGFEKGTKTLKDRLNSVINSLKRAGIGTARAFSDTGSINATNVSIQALIDEIDRYTDALYYLEKQGLYFGDKEYDEAYQKLARAEQALNNYKKSLVGLDKQQKKTSLSTKKLNENLKKTTRTSIPLVKSIFKLSNMFKLLLIRMAMRSVINAVKEGMQNLAQYSKQVNKDMSILATSAQTLKNSFATAFAPILQVITPALKILIDHLSEALSLIGQFFAVLLTGATTFTKAKDAQVDYAKSIAKTAKEANKALSPIDKLNVVGGDSESGGSYSGPTPSQMFEEVAIGSKIIEAVARIKATFSEFGGWLKKTFGPVVASVWEDMAPNVATFKKIVSSMLTDIQSLGTPLLTYFNKTLIPSLQSIGLIMGGILNGWFETFNMVLSDTWNLAVFPILENFITTGLPMLTEFKLGAVQILGAFHKELKGIFDMLWKGAVAPALGLSTKIWIEFMDTVKGKWDEWGKPTINNIKKVFETTGGLIKEVWKTTLKPIWDAFMKTVDKLWQKHLKPFVGNIIDLVATLANAALNIYNKFIAPVVKWFVQKFGPPIAKVVSWLIEVFGNFVGGILNLVNKVIKTLTKIITFIEKTFTGDWKKAWEGIKRIFKGVWNALVGIVKTPVNLIIGIINGLIKGITAGINTVIKGINSIRFSIPGWVPGIGGKSVGFNLKQISAPKIPRLATGTVVPANYGEFLAILGDNKREAEVVSPISAMKQAFKEAMTEMGGAGTGTINLNVYLEGRQIHSEVVRQDRQYKKETGKSAFAY